MPQNLHGRGLAPQTYGFFCLLIVFGFEMTVMSLPLWCSRWVALVVVQSLPTSPTVNWAGWSVLSVTLTGIAPWVGDEAVRRIGGRDGLPVASL